MKTRKLLTSKNSGQASVEAVLAVVIIVTVAMYTSQQFRSRKILASLVEGPWSYIDGMAQHGVWGSAKKVIVSNPYSSRRVSSGSEIEQ